MLWPMSFVRSICCRESDLLSLCPSDLSCQVCVVDLTVSKRLNISLRNSAMDLLMEFAILSSISRFSCLSVLSCSSGICFPLLEGPFPLLFPRLAPFPAVGWSISRAAASALSRASSPLRCARV